jgi:uncharacterized protein (DUF1330 family)
MAAYVLAEIEVHDANGYEDYRRLAGATLGAFGGRFLVRGGDTATIEGDWSPHRMVVIEFPSTERAHAWWASPEYAAARAIRQRTATTRMIVAEGVC